jgi:hypothetical protein
LEQFESSAGLCSEKGVDPLHRTSASKAADAAIQGLPADLLLIKPQLLQSLKAAQILYAILFGRIVAFDIEYCLTFKIDLEHVL